MLPHSARSIHPQLCKVSPAKERGRNLFPAPGIWVGGWMALLLERAWATGPWERVESAGVPPCAGLDAPGLRTVIYVGVFPQPAAQPATPGLRWMMTRNDPGLWPKPDQESSAPGGPCALPSRLARPGIPTPWYSVDFLGQHQPTGRKRLAQAWPIPVQRGLSFPRTPWPGPCHPTRTPGPTKFVRLGGRGVNHG